MIPAIQLAVPPDATRVRVTLPGDEVHFVNLPRPSGIL